MGSVRVSITVLEPLRLDPVGWIHAELARWWKAELARDSEQPPWKRSDSSPPSLDSVASLERDATPLSVRSVAPGRVWRT